MFPYIELGGTSFYTMGIGMIIAFICFIFVVKYLCNKYHQDFLRFFYWLPILIILTYVFGAYVGFVLNGGIIPTNLIELRELFLPNNYNFNFIGILVAYGLAIHIFLRKIKRKESKKMWIDILFISTALSMVLWGIFATLGDSFIGLSYYGPLAIKALHIDSALNKFDGVFPIGILLSLFSLLSVVLMIMIKKRIKKFGAGIYGFIILLILINIVFLFQQYPRYIPIAIGSLKIDIRAYVSFLFLMLLFYTKSRK